MLHLRLQKKPIRAICVPISTGTPDSNLPFLVSSLTLCASPACGIQGRGHIVTIVIYSYNSYYSGTETPLLALPENGGFNHGRIFLRMINQRHQTFTGLPLQVPHVDLSQLRAGEHPP